MLVADNCAFIDFSENRLIIAIRRNLIEDDEFKIVDRNTGVVVGQLIIPDDIGGYKSLGSLRLGKNEYIFEKHKPSVRLNIFDRHTWGNYKFQLSNSEFKATYQFQLKVSLFEMQGRRFKNFDAEIEIKGFDLLATFCGLFLTEQALETEDNKRM